MKTILSLIAILAIAGSATAQQVGGPLRQNALTVSTAFLVPGSSTTNIPSTLAPVFLSGRDGLGFSVYVAGTNAASTTNMTILLEPLIYNGSGVSAAGNQTWTISVPQTGTTAYPYWTNLANTTANLSDVVGVRIKSIQNTNLASLFISNVTAYARP